MNVIGRRRDLAALSPGGLTKVTLRLCERLATHTHRRSPAIGHPPTPDTDAGSLDPSVDREGGSAAEISHGEAHAAAHRLLEVPGRTGADLRKAPAG